LFEKGLELHAHSDLRGSGRRNDVDGCAQPLRVIDVVEDVLSEVRVCPKFAALKRLNTSNISSRRGSLPRRKSLFTRTSTL